MDNPSIPVINLQWSRINIEDNLLFVLSELVDDTPAQIMGYFMDRAVEVARCPSNCFRKSWDQSKLKYVRTTVGNEEGLCITVLRGYYPSTPIAFKMTVCVSPNYAGDENEKAVVAKIAMIAESKRWTSLNFEDVADATTRESLIGDHVFNPKLVRPKALTPTGATPQHYKKDKKKATAR